MENFHEKMFQRIREIFETGNPEYLIRKYEGEEYKSFEVRIIKDYEFVNSYLEFANKHTPKLLEYESHSIGIDVPNVIQSFDATLTKSYLVLNLYNSKKRVALKKRGTDTEYSVNVYTNKLKTLIVHGDGGIVTSKSFKSPKNDKNIFYPTTVKDIMLFPKEIYHLIGEMVSEGSFLYKDFIADDFHATLPIKELKNFHSKREYFDKMFPYVKFPKSTNRMNCGEVYFIGCAAKFVEPEEIHLLFQKAYRLNYIMSDEMNKRNLKNLATRYLSELLFYRVSPEVNSKEKEILKDYDLKYTIKDYLRMSFELKQKVSIVGKKKRILHNHDNCSIAILKKSLRNKRNKLKIPETPLKYLKLPSEFILLNTMNALCEEQARQQNCVASYMHRIEKGQCLVCTADIKEEHVTIEIVYKKNKKGYSFSVRQCCKRYNHPCRKETFDYVKQSVENATEDALKNYLNKVKLNEKNTLKETN